MQNHLSATSLVLHEDVDDLEGEHLAELLPGHDGGGELLQGHLHSISCLILVIPVLNQKVQPKTLGPTVFVF